jgi:hypothetical protein
MAGTYGGRRPLVTVLISTLRPSPLVMPRSTAMQTVLACGEQAT